MSQFNNESQAKDKFYCILLHQNKIFNTVTIPFW